METIKIQNTTISTGSLILVNGQHPYQRSKENPLVPVDTKNSNILLEITTAGIFEKIMYQLNAWKQIVHVSGWRSNLEQKSIFYQSMVENGKAYTEQFVARPNHSEHQTGLPIDVALNQADIDFICPEFPYTGIAHEPWHFRYVGAPHAEIMHRNKMSLEEYHDFLKQHPYGQRHFSHQLGNRKIEVSYLTVADGDSTFLKKESHMPCLISGNNMDGFIVTQWNQAIVYPLVLNKSGFNCFQLNGIRGKR